MDQQQIHARGKANQNQQDDWDDVHQQMIEVQDQKRVQKKSLDVSQPDDDDEKEADEVAHKVVSGESAMVYGTGGAINRKGECSTEPNTEFHSRLDSNKGRGESLPESVQLDIGSKMGADFSEVKIHNGSEANAMSAGINAKAFTHGTDIYFNNGNYNPFSSEGKELLAHELVHIVQQGNEKMPSAVQRVTQTNVKAVCGPAMAHADGTYDAATATYRTPADKSSYTETLKSDPDHLYDTYYSIACRFGLDPADIMAVNKKIPAKKIKHNMAIIIPDIAPYKNLCDPKNVLPPQIVNQPQVPAQVPAIVQAPVCTIKDRGQFDSDDVKRSAWLILKDNPSIQRAYIFLHKIDVDFPDAKDQLAELYKFFDVDDPIKGPYVPNLGIKTFTAKDGGNATGYTPETNTALSIPNQNVSLNDVNNESVAISTYLHEMNHYIDQWYHSSAAKSYSRYRDQETEYGTGVAPKQSGDLTEAEQVSALSEYEEINLNQIIADMQLPALRSGEHPAVKDLRKAYQDLVTSTEFLALKIDDQIQAKADFVKDAQKDVKGQIKDAYGRTLFRKRWNMKTRKGKFTNTGIELGFAFEKMAYGFYDQQLKNADWADNFNAKFETKYCKYFQ